MDEPSTDPVVSDAPDPGPFAEDAEILEAQERLGKSLENARAGDDRVLGVAVREDGEHFVRVLYGLLRMIRLHDLSNEAFEKPILELVESTKALLELLGVINIVSVEEQIYVNDIRIRFDERTETGRMLGAELYRHRVGGLTIHSALEVEDIKALVHVFARDPDPTAPRTVLVEGLQKRGVDQLELFGVFRFRVTGEEVQETGGKEYQEIQEEMLDTVDRGADLVEDSLENMGSNRMPNPVPLRRMVTEIIEGGEGAEGLWDEANSANPYGAHVVRVTRVVLMIGEALGLSEEAMQDLGVSALFHDVGYAAREGGTPATDDQPAIEGYPPPFERHAAAGARMLMRQRGFHLAKILRILSTLEHNDDFNAPRGMPSLFARILKIAEDFDTLIRARGGGFSSAEAIQRMVAHSGTRYDPDLLQLFVNCMGKYPPGSMLLLADGRIAVSVGVAPDEAAFSKPVVRVIRDAQGQMYEEVVIENLAEAGGVRLVLNSRPELLARSAMIEEEPPELDEEGVENADSATGSEDVGPESVDSPVAEDEEAEDEELGEHEEGGEDEV